MVAAGSSMGGGAAAPAPQTPTISRCPRDVEGAQEREASERSGEGPEGASVAWGRALVAA